MPLTPWPGHQAAEVGWSLCTSAGLQPGTWAGKLLGWLLGLQGVGNRLHPVLAGPGSTIGVPSTLYAMPSTEAPGQFPTKPNSWVPELPKPLMVVRLPQKSLPVGGRQAKEAWARPGGWEEPKRCGRRPRSRPASVVSRAPEGLSQASYNKLHVNNSAAARELIALAPHLSAEGEGSH